MALSFEIFLTVCFHSHAAFCLISDNIKHCNDFWENAHSHTYFSNNSTTRWMVISFLCILLFGKLVTHEFRARWLNPCGFELFPFIAVSPDLFSLCQSLFHNFAKESHFILPCDFTTFIRGTRTDSATCSIISAGISQAIYSLQHYACSNANFPTS